MQYRIIGFILFLTFIVITPTYAQTFKKIDRVVIDAGHGGKDPGTVGKKAYEKDIALSVALKLGKYIEENLPDVDVVYTRKTDVFIELYKRARIANKDTADVFISIHCNATVSSSAVGTETWIIGATKGARNLAIAQKENAAILYEADYEKRYDNFDPNSPESYIIFELFQSSYREQSESLAIKVQKQFSNRLHRVDRGVKEAGFLVLVNTTMPSILVETGFLSNPDEEKYLISEKGQNEIASGIYRAFKEYKTQMEKDNEPIEFEENLVIDTTNNIEENPEVKTANSSDDLVFGVQFLASKNVLKTGCTEFKGLNNVWSYKDNDYNKYVSGRFKSVEDANVYAKKMRGSDFPGAFVIAFMNGKRIPKNEALKMVQQ